MKFKLIYSALILLSLANCAQSDDLVIDENQENLFYWDQTACLDPWGTGRNDSNKETSKALKEYLKQNAVEAIEIGFKDTREEGVVDCDSCGCPTWIRIFIKINKEDHSRIEELGFTKLGNSENE